VELERCVVDHRPVWCCRVGAPGARFDDVIPSVRASPPIAIDRDAEPADSADAAMRLFALIES